jgi:sugar phosphate isomerase/epimerase
MSCLNSLAQLESVFAHIPGLMLNADLFHLWWDPDLERVLRGNGVAIGLLQVSDVAQESAGVTMPQRVPLDEGFLDWRACVRHVRLAFPQAQVELELFANQLPGRALDELLRTNAAALENFFIGERHGDRQD